MLNKVLSFMFCALLFGSSVYASDLNKVRENFLSGNYKSAIIEGEKILAGSGSGGELEELYYILGLSYLKDGNYLRAADIFEIILSELKTTRFKAQSRLGLADSNFLRNNFEKAKAAYLELLGGNDAVFLKASIYYRLSQCEAKLGNAIGAKAYIEKLNTEFPDNFETGLENPSQPGDFYYSVQVGSFINKANAESLMRKLQAKGYAAFVEEGISAGAAIYRVKSGKLFNRNEAVGLEAKLSAEGYPTKICP